MPHRYLTVAELLAFRGEAELLRLAPAGGAGHPLSRLCDRAGGG